MENSLTTHDLKKNYRSKQALRGINLSLESGKIYGLFGPNGSGKTTFMKIAAGLLKQSGGEITIDGKNPGVETKAKVAYLPDANYLYTWMKIKDAIAYFADMYEDFDVAKANEMITLMELNLGDKVTSLSKGMVARLKLSLVMARDAKLYLFDEPLSGIDPVSRDKIIDMMLTQFETGKTMLISTHLVQNIERIIDEVVFILDGEIILQGSAEAFRNEKKMSIDELYREVYQ